MSNTNNNPLSQHQQRLALEVSALTQRDQRNGVIVQSPDGDTVENARDIDEEAEIVVDSTREGHLRPVVMLEDRDRQMHPAPGQPGNQYMPVPETVPLMSASRLCMLTALDPINCINRIGLALLGGADDKFSLRSENQPQHDFDGVVRQPRRCDPVQLHTAPTPRPTIPTFFSPRMYTARHPMAPLLDYSPTFQAIQLWLLHRDLSIIMLDIHTVNETLVGSDPWLDPRLDYLASATLDAFTTVTRMGRCQRRAPWADVRDAVAAEKVHVEWVTRWWDHLVKTAVDMGLVVQV